MAENTKKQINLIDFLNRNSKKFIIGAVVLAGIALSAFFGMEWAYRNVAAVVGNQFITKSEVNRQVQLNTAVSKVTGNTYNNTFDKAKDQLVNRATIQIIAKKNNISISNNDLENEIKRIADEKYDGNKDFVYQGYEQAYGYTRDEIRLQIANQLLEDKVRDELVNNITGKYVAVSYKETTQLLSYSKVATGQVSTWAKSQSQDLLNTLNSGKTFEALYTDFSNEKGYPAYVYDAGEWNGLIFDNSRFSQVEWAKILNEGKTDAANGPYHDSDKYYVLYPTKIVKDKSDSFKELVDSYKAKYYHYDSSARKNIFVTARDILIGKAYACVACNSNNSICALFYCSCGSCQTLCGATQAPRCPAGHTCSLSSMICSSGCGTNTCGGGDGGGGTVTPPPPPVNGKCGGSNGDTLTWNDRPTAMCSYGSAYNLEKVVRDGIDRWTWKCTGSNGGSTSSCAADIGYKLTVVKDGCGVGRVTDDRDPQKIRCGGDCLGVYTGQWVKLKEDPATGSAFVGWEKLWDNASNCGDNIFCSISMGDNRKIRAIFGYAVRVTINGKGKVVDNRSPHKIVCENTDPNSVKTCNQEVYSATSLKLVATATDANYPFIRWNGSPCEGSTNTTCDFADRCTNTNLLVANFRSDAAKVGKCWVSPEKGLSPLVAKVEYDPADLKVNQLSLGDGASRSNIPSPFYYTYTSSGQKKLTMRFDANGDGALDSTAECGTVNVNIQTKSAGGEVAP